jgi:N-methylhydantoinase A
MRYLGQRKEITVEVPGERFDGRRAPVLREAFESRYESIYHRRHDGHPVEVLCWRLEARGPQTMELPSREKRGNGAKARPRASRPVLFAGWTRYRDCPVYSRYELASGTRLRGPSVVEEDESSTVVGPGGAASVDGYGNLIISVPAAGGGR